jgi:ketosteroid isomerase-like protein
MKRFIVCLTLLGVFAGLAFSQDKLERARVRLLELDAAFSRLSVEKGAGAAFAAHLADDAVFLPIGENLITGKAAIVKYFSDGESTLSWKPLKAEIAKSGELGYTYGTSELATKDKDGKTQVRHYKYVSVWKRQKNGDWKLALDIGNQSPAPVP